jgi:predicted deacylase
MDMPAAQPGRVLTLAANDFVPAYLPRGEKHLLNLRLPPPHDRVVLPAVVMRGSRSGKTLVVTAGVHGDEYEGVRALLAVTGELDPKSMSGHLLAVPAANPAAVWAVSRCTPDDGGNLARAFPGRPDGTLTEALAYTLGEYVIARGDFYLDLHSGGINLSMPTMVGYDHRDGRAAAAARTFGVRVLWSHASIPPGRTISLAGQRGIPWLYTESRGGGRVHPDDLRALCGGILNLLRHLKIIEGDVAPVEPELHLAGDGNIDSAIAAGQPGFLIPVVALMDRVADGQVLGRLVDLHGHTLELYRAPAAGVVAMIRELPVVTAGDSLFLVAGLLE